MRCWPTSLPEIEEVMESGTPTQKNAIVRSLVHEILIDGNRAYPQYRVPIAGVRMVGVPSRGLRHLRATIKRVAELRLFHHSGQDRQKAIVEYVACQKLGTTWSEFLPESRDRLTGRFARK